MPSSASLASVGVKRGLVAQAVASFGLAAGGISGALLATDLAGPTAGVAAVGAVVAGAALSAPSLSWLMRHDGRSTGLRTGYFVAAAGAAGVTIAARSAQLWWLLAASVVLGAGNSAVMLTRYAIADLVAPDRRGRAMSRSLAATAAGAIVGPNLLRPAASLAGLLRLPDPAGLHVLAVAAFAGAALLVRPGTETPAQEPEPAPVFAGAHDEAAVDDAGRRLAFGVLATANAVMVAVMAAATAHLRAHGTGIGAIGVVVSLHVAGMFAGSPVVGWLCDRVGAPGMALAGSVLLAGVGAVGVAAGDQGIVHTGGLLVVLGVAWNVQVVSGSVLLAGAVAPARRLVAEGRAELVMSAAAVAGIVLGAAPLAAVGGLRLLSAAVVVAGTATATRLGLVMRTHPRVGPRPGPPVPVRSLPF